MQRQTLRAINETIAIFDSHIRTNESLRLEALPHEVSIMEAHHRDLTARRDEMICIRRDIECKLKSSSDLNRSFDGDTKSDTQSIQPSFNDCTGSPFSVISPKPFPPPSFPPSNSTKTLTSPTSITTPPLLTTTTSDDCNYAVIATTRESDSLPHEDERTWLIDCDRNEAERILTGKCSGSFLIRNSRRGQYALSVLVNNRVHHCLINKSPDGYGFAEGYNIHPTLKSLVLHYRKISLAEHNNLLHTTLAHPVFAQQS